MKVAIFLSLGDSLENMRLYGQETKFVNFYIKEYSKNFDKVFLFSYSQKEKTKLPKNVKIIVNKYNLHRYLYSLLFPFMERNILKEIDIIRAYHLSGTIAAILTKFLLGKKYIFNLGFNYYEFAIIERHYIQAILFKLLQPISIFFADKVFVANRTLSNKVQKSKAVYLPNGVDITFFKSKRKKRGNKFIILSVGRLEPQKNFLNLIKAISGMPVALTLVGRGSLKEQIIKLAKNQMVNLKLIDRVDNLCMPDIYSSADLFVLPSLIEGHPKVLLEAMSCGLPVVGTNVVGIKDVVKNEINGVLVNTSPEAIRRGISKLINNFALRKSVSEQARKTILERFNLENLIETEINTVKGAI